MKKEEIEAYVNEAYPSFQEKLKSIEDSLVAMLETYHEKAPELVAGGDFRPGTVGRMLSSCISCRFLLDTTIDFIEQKDWGEKFQSEYTPKPFAGNGYFGHFQGIDLMLRFYLFHQFYHQLETTARIICKAKSLSGKKPFDEINSLTNAFPEGFIEFFDAVRNTIHNNGYYNPRGNQRKVFNYEMTPFSFHFKDGEKVNLSMDALLFLLNDLIEHVADLLGHSAIRDTELTKDKN